MPCAPLAWPGLCRCPGRLVAVERGGRMKEVAVQAATCWAVAERGQQLSTDVWNAGRVGGALPLRWPFEPYLPICMCVY